MTTFFAFENSSHVMMYLPTNAVGFRRHGNRVRWLDLTDQRDEPEMDYVEGQVRVLTVEQVIEEVNRPVTGKDDNTRK